MGNNPIRNIDPRGDWFHIAFGAAIGAIANAAIQGFSGNINSMADFGIALGIGAVAGGLAAGVGGGVSAALVGQGFGAGFIGSASGATIGFTAGAATGAAGGFAGGFTTGFSNSLLLNGGGFGSSLNAGLWEGAIAGLTGGVVGGLSGGISALVEGREFMSGSYSTYEIKDELIAGTNMIGQSNSDGSYLLNRDSKRVYYLRETGGHVGSRDFVEPGHFLEKGVKVDGIATSLHRDRVFKISGKPWLGVSQTAIVREGGTVMLVSNPWSTFHIHAGNTLGYMRPQGWLTPAQSQKSHWLQLTISAALGI